MINLLLLRKDIVFLSTAEITRKSFFNNFLIVHYTPFIVYSKEKENLPHNL